MKRTVGIWSVTAFLICLIALPADAQLTKLSVNGVQPNTTIVVLNVSNLPASVLSTNASNIQEKTALEKLYSIGDQPLGIQIGERLYTRNIDLYKFLFQQSATTWFFNLRSLGNYAEQVASNSAKRSEIVDRIRLDLYGNNSAPKDIDTMFRDVFGSNYLPQYKHRDRLVDNDKLLLVCQALYDDASVHDIAEIAGAETLRRLIYNNL